MNSYNCNYYAHICNKECAHILISAIGIMNFAEIYGLSFDKIAKLCWHIIHFITRFCCN